MGFKTTHKLEFQTTRPNLFPHFNDEFSEFKIGTCQGLWRSTDNTYDILAVLNTSPSNGHFTDVLEWFENSCKRDNKNFRFLEVWNPILEKHLLNKQGFVKDEGDNLIKYFIKA